MPGFRLIFGRFTWDNRATVSIFCVSFVMKSKIGLRIRELDGKMGGIQLSNRVYGCAHTSHRTHTRLSGSCGVQHQHATSASQSINITHHRFSINPANPGQTFRRTPQEFELITVRRHKQNHEPNQRNKLKAFVIWLYKNVCVCCLRPKCLFTAHNLQFVDVWRGEGDAHHCFIKILQRLQFPLFFN